MKATILLMLFLILISHQMFAQTPTISSFTPTRGKYHSTVTITGTNFSTIPSENLVEFNSVDAIVTAATATTLTVIVPHNAISGKIIVTVNGLWALSSQSFIVLTY